MSTEKAQAGHGLDVKPSRLVRVTAWVSREESLPSETRVLAFSPVYPRGHPMRHRMMDAQFFKLCLEATHWMDLHLIEPNEGDSSAVSDAQRDSENALFRIENARLRSLLEQCAAMDYMGEVRELVDGMDDEVVAE